MIKAALQYIMELGKTGVLDIKEQKYSTNRLFHIADPIPSAISITTLTGLVDYLKSNMDGGYMQDVYRPDEPLLIHVCSPTSVKLYSSIKDDVNRDCFIECQAQVPSVCFNSFVDTEKFNIMIQSCFLRNEDADEILKIIGNIREETVRGTNDDGISQEVTVKSGIARVSNVTIPNPVLLEPYRTFTEIEQPESKFVFRMKDGPQAALFEADGGAWKNAAMINIKEYLKRNLNDLPVVIIA